MLKNLKRHLDGFRLYLKHVGSQERRVLAVIDSSLCKDALRVFAIENRWHLLFALTLQNAIDIQRATRSNVIISTRICRM